MSEMKMLAMQLAALKKIAVAAKALRESGYDGPFTGPICEPLFKALREWESPQEQVSEDPVPNQGTSGHHERDD